MGKITLINRGFPWLCQITRWWCHGREEINSYGMLWINSKLRIYSRMVSLKVSSGFNSVKTLDTYDDIMKYHPKRSETIGLLQKTKRGHNRNTQIYSGFKSIMFSRKSQCSYHLRLGRFWWDFQRVSTQKMRVLQTNGHCYWNAMSNNVFFL